MLKRTTTTVKISRRAMTKIDSIAVADESVDETLRRYWKLGTGHKKVKGAPPPNTTIKISRDVMKYIQDEAKQKESRDQTICRLLGIGIDDGNVRAKA